MARTHALLRCDNPDCDLKAWSVSLRHLRRIFGRGIGPACPQCRQPAVVWWDGSFGRRIVKFLQRS